MADAVSRVYGPALLTGAAATLYTVPALTTLTIKQIWVFNSDVTTSYNLTLSIGSDAAGTRIYDAYPIVGKAIENEKFWLPVAAGEIIQGFASTTNKLLITISGVLTT